MCVCVFDANLKSNTMCRLTVIVIGRDKQRVGRKQVAVLLSKNNDNNILYFPNKVFFVKLLNPCGTFVSDDIVRE